MRPSRPTEVHCQNLEWLQVVLGGFGGLAFERSTTKLFFAARAIAGPAFNSAARELRGWVVFIDALRHLCPGLTNPRFVEVSRCRLSGLIYSTLLSRGSRTLQSTCGHLLVLVMTINSTWTCRSVRRYNLSCLRWRLSFVLMGGALFRGDVHQHLCNSLARVRDNLLTTF